MEVENDFAVPQPKRRRVENGDQGESKFLRRSRLFAPFRTVGLVSPTVVPFTSIPLGTMTFQVTTNVGRQLQTYDLRRGLNLVFLTTPLTPKAITATCAYKNRVLVAWGEASGQDQGIWIFQRGKLVDKLHVPSGGLIKQIQVFGSWLIACGTSEIHVWRGSGLAWEYYTTLRPLRSDVSSSRPVLAGVFCTLPTYLNKILVGRSDGTAELWNVRTGKCLHYVPPPDPEAGAITTMQATPALYCVAIAYASGALVLHHVERDEIILSFRQKLFPITSISFRSDCLGAGTDGQQDGVMATASLSSGDITLWDLNDGGRVAGILREAHQTTSKPGSGITKIEFLPNQSILLSTGLDNSLRSWIFDRTPYSAVPRPLHARSGHAGPITTLDFLPAASDGSDAVGKWLLSASSARDFWGFSLRRDGQSSELSQGQIKHKAKTTAPNHLMSSVEALKAPPITSIACSLNRDGGMGASEGPIWQNVRGSKAEESSMTGWESIVTAHENDPVARTWFWGRRRAGRWTFRTGDGQPVSSVATSSCGTFAIVGSLKGSLDMYNLQSGIHRQRFPPRLSSKAEKVKQQVETVSTVIRPGHSGSISGIMVDAVNRHVVSASLDGTIRIWDFSSGKQVASLSLPDNSNPTALQYNPTSELVSIACDDLCIRVLDVETRRIVRELWGSAGQIHDHCFSHDGRWIISCSMDSVIRVFDLATGHLVDAFKTPPCTNVAFSGTGEYLATAHSGSAGINVWSNRNLFRHVPLQQIDEDLGVIDLRDETVFENSNILAIEDGTDLPMQNVISKPDATTQLSEDLLTLSLLPKSRWQTLLYLDDIRARNKPIEPPKAPEKAPFFLSSALSAPPPTTLPQSANDASTLLSERSRISRVQASQARHGSTFSNLLADFCDNDNDPTTGADAVMAHLSSLPPAQMDLEIRSLRLAELVPFVQALTARLRQKRDFELVNSFMACFLRLHGDVLQEGEEGDNGDLVKVVGEWYRVMREEEKRLGELVGYCRGVLEFLRTAR